MPKTPDEIKKGLECCGKGLTWDETCGAGCPYQGMHITGCSSEISADALALIQQLEAENAALLKDLREADMNGCEHCKHYRLNDPECSCECGTCINPCPCNECYHNNLWQWRGVQKEDNDK